MRVAIEGLSFEAIIGLLPEERRKPQEVVVDLFLEYDYRPDHFLDYAEAARIVERHIREGKFLLVEEALTSLVPILKGSFPSIKYIEISLSKPKILPSGVPKVTIKRTFI